MKMPPAMSTWTWIITGIVCGLGALVALTYLVVSRPGNVRQGVWCMESPAAFRGRMRRRRLGAALLVAVSVAFPAGLWLDPRHQPVGYMIYWAIVLVMLAWLVGLGIVDLLQTRRMFREPDRQDRNTKQ